MPGPGRKVKFKNTVFVFNGFTVDFRILLSKCLNPKLRSNVRFNNDTRSEMIN